MKLLIDFFPIILFFVAFKFAGIYVATGVAIAATIAPDRLAAARTGKVEPMQWVSLGVIVLFGGATIALQNETFIKWKPTVLYWLMAGTLMAGQLIFQQEPAEVPHGFAARAARGRLARHELELDRVFRRHGRAQPLGRLSLRHRHLGQLQAVRRAGPDGRCS